MDLINIEDLEIYLKTIISLVPARIYWKNIDGVFLGANDKAATYAGFRYGEELKGKTDYEMPWKDRADAIHKHDIEIIRSRKKIEMEETVLLDNGGKATFLTQKVPLVNQCDQIIGVLYVSFNITDRKKAAEAIKIFKEKIKILRETEIKQQQYIAQLETLSSTDSLTGIWNRYHFEKMLTIEVNRSVRYQQPLSLLFLDIDNFKHINDAWGHISGDEVLQELTKIILTNIRNSDMLFRWGGDEFIILTPYTSFHQATSIAELIRTKVEQHLMKTVGHITISLAVVEHILGENADVFFRRADAVLKAAKKSGRNCVKVDQRGSSDIWEKQGSTFVLHLDWHDSYYCGEPTIDQQHRKLFELGNALIQTMFIKDKSSKKFDLAMKDLVTEVVQHFKDEEAILLKYKYQGFEEQKKAHQELIEHLQQLDQAVKAKTAKVGDLVNFLANEFVVEHMLKIDLKFYPLFKKNL